MPIDKVSVGRVYKMSSGETVIVTREWTAQDGHMRVEGRAVFDGEAHEPVDNASALKGCGVAHRLMGTELKRELTYVE